jgi:hypothetical protein
MMWSKLFVIYKQKEIENIYHVEKEILMIAKKITSYICGMEVYIC